MRAGRLEIADLHRRFGARRALDGVSFTVEPGEIVGLVGRNGAGKTTAMRSIIGIVRPDGGTVRWRGRPLGESDRLAFGYMPEERGLYPHMAILRQVAYFGRLHGMAAAAAEEAAGTWLERLALGDRREERLVALSHGNQQRVQLAVALVHDPGLLVLDEPFAGLDPEAVDSLSSVLAEQAENGKAILFSSHQLELVERICRRVVIVDEGRVLVAGSLRELRARFPAHLRVKVDSSPDWASRLAGAQVVSIDQDGVVLVVEPSTDTQAILRAALAQGPVEHFAFETAGLVDLYRQALSA